MNWLKFSVAVLLTSVTLVVALFATGAFLVGHAVASELPRVAQVHRSQDPKNVPPELANFKDIPEAERFAHFQGVQLSLTDKNGQPVSISVTPGVASNVSAESLTIAGNDGASHTYALNDQTFNRGGTLADGDKVVVVTINNTSTARGVISLNREAWHHGS